MHCGHIYCFLPHKNFHASGKHNFDVKVILSMEGDRVFLPELWQLGIMITGLKVHSEI